MAKQSARVGEHGWRLKLYEQLGKAMRVKRDEMGLTLAELGRRVGCTGSVLQKIEQGMQPCPLHILVAFRDVTGANLEDLVPRVEVAAEKKPEPAKKGFWATLGTHPVR